MPLTHYRCPDGRECPVNECLKHCRLEGKMNPTTGMLYVPCGRCLSRRALLAIAAERRWTGRPSTTQLLNGTLEEYLKLTEPYTIDPMQSVFALHGTAVHEALEENTEGNAMTEKRLDDGVSTGAFDYFDEEATDEENTGYLYDDKTYGSYKAAKVLGAVKHKEQIGLYKNGKPKYRTYFTYDGVHGSGRLDLAIQLNDYRMKLKKCLGKTAKKMICEMIVRDGNTYMAESRGVMQPAYLVEVNKISDHWVSKYMKAKADNLVHAMETGLLPKQCSYRERWGGMKCERFCNVKDKCPYVNIKEI